MKNISPMILFILLTVAFLPSCATHYIGTWQNQDEASVLTDNRVYAIKKDTLGISHAFNTPSGNVKERMENYTDKPMLINLTKSAMTINGKAQGYVDGKSTFNGRLDTFGGGRDFVGSTGLFEGEILGGTNTLIIPPYSFVEGEYTNIKAEKQMALGTDFDGNLTSFPLFDEALTMKTKFFEAEESPLQLKSYINYSILDKNNEPISTDVLTQSFYLSRYFRLREMSTQDLRQKMYTREELSSYTEVKGGGAGLLLLLGGLIGAAALIGPEDN